MSHREIRSLKEELADKGARLAAFDERVTRLRAERDAARSEASELARELAEARADLKAMTSKLSDQEKMIERQAKTIKVQSEQIAGPRETNTPRRIAGPRGPVYTQPPPFFTLPPPVPKPSPSGPVQNTRTPTIGSVHHMSPAVAGQAPAAGQAQHMRTPILGSGPSMRTPTAGQAHTMPAPPLIGQDYSQSSQVHGMATPGIGHQYTGVPSAYPQPNPNFRASSSLQPSVFPPPGSKPPPFPSARDLVPSRGDRTPKATNRYTPSTPDPRQNLTSRSPHPNPSTSGSVVVYQPSHNQSLTASSQSGLFNKALSQADVPNRNPNPTPFDLESSTSSLTIRPDSDSETLWRNELHRLFTLAERWAANYAKYPNQHRDRNLGPVLMSAFTRQTEIAYMKPLLASEATRYFMVARLLNTWITGDILKPEAFKPFWPAIDERASKLLDMVRKNPVAHAVSALQWDLADAAKEMSGDSRFRQWVQHSAHWKCYSVWSHLQQIIDLRADEKQAWEDLMYLFIESFQVAQLMMLHPFAYSISYPPVGKTSTFNPTLMLSRDPTYRGNPQSLAHQRLHIRLAITPVVTITDYLSGSITSQTCHYSNVLLQG